MRVIVYEIVLFIVGSLRKESFNRQLAAEAEALLKGKAEVEYLDFQNIPYMNQDIEFPAPKEVARIRERVGAADAVWIFTPEYNSSYPGLLKNLLDWLSRPVVANDYATPTVIGGKRTAVSGVAGKSAGANSMDKLCSLLEMMKADLVKEPRLGIALPPESWQTGLLILTDDHRRLLAEEAEALLGEDE